MKAKHLLPALLLTVSLASAQTTGVPGNNDFVINGSGSGGTSCLSTSVGSSITMDVSALSGSVLLGLIANSCGPAIPVGAATGTFDIDFASFDVWVDGTNSFAPGNPLNFFANIGPSGQWSLSLAGFATPGPLGALQFAMLGAAYANGLELTQAHDVSITASLCVPQANIGPITDDSSVQVTLSMPFTFYGVSYSDVFINDNGNLTFTAGDTDFSATDAEFLAGNPRVAPCWGDFVPVANEITYGDTAGVLTVVWDQIGLFFSTDSNTFCTTLDSNTGVISMAWDGMDLTEDPGAGSDVGNELVGISSGGSLSAATSIDLSSFLGSGTGAALPDDAIFEWFGPNTAGGTSTFDLSFQTASFVPMGVGSGPYFFF